MGRMKEIYMDLYYSMDGFIPPEYDLNGYLAKIANDLKNQEEYEYKQKTQEGSDKDDNTLLSSEKRDPEDKGFNKRND
jgi:hypothetical protein